MKPGLSFHLGPPLGRTLSFFLVVPLSMVAAGALVFGTGVPLFSSSWFPATVALVHLGTLGLLASAMLGAVFQLSPVLGGVSVPGSAASLWGLGLGLGGLGAFSWGLLSPSTAAVYVAIAVLFPVLCWFALSAIWALRLAPRETQTLRAMRTALWSLVATVVLGTWMAHGYTGDGFPGPRGLWIQVHLCMGLLGWVGGLLVGVSWELVPMFYLAPSVPEATKRRVVSGLQGCLVFIVLLHVVSLLFSVSPEVARWLGVGAAGALSGIVWLWHPVSTFRTLRARRRRRVDPSKDYWLVSMGLGPISLVLGAATLFGADPRWALTFGWVAIWGWAGVVIHGMLTRIVPFLVWLHRFSKLTARPDAPTMADIFPARRARLGLFLHLGTLVLAVAAVWRAGPVLVAAVGVGLCLTGIHLAVAMVGALSLSRRSPISDG